jgi:phosphoglycolate phosphatase
MRFDTVLFDLDGTLVDSREGILLSLAAALRELGHDDVDTRDLSRVIGPPLQEIFAGLGVPPQSIERAIAAYRSVYEAGALRANRAFDGIDAALRTLASRGATLGVCTSKPWVYAEQIVAQHGWTDLMQVVSGPELDGTRRHKPEILTHALTALDDPARDRVVMIGDRHYDIDGAHAVGVSSIAVTWGFGSAQELRAAKPDFVVQAPAELVSLASRM